MIYFTAQRISDPTVTVRVVGEDLGPVMYEGKPAFASRFVIDGVERLTHVLAETLAPALSVAQARETIDVAFLASLDVDIGTMVVVSGEGMQS